MKVLHILYQSLPNVKGASIRSRNILRAQSDLGVEVCVISSPFQEPAGDLDPQGGETIEGIKYYRSWNHRPEQAVSAGGSGWLGRLKKLLSWPAFVRRLEETARLEEVDLLHAHGMFYVGMAARRVARKLGIPWVYEVRSVWEDNAVLHGVYGKVSPFLFAIRALERSVCRSAPAVTTICEGLRQDLLQRGVDPERITLAPNAVHPEAGSGQANSPDCFTIGSLGGLSRTEGLHTILEAAAILRKEVRNLRILLVGAGAESGKLALLAAKLGVDDLLEMPGSVPPEEAGVWYSRFDLFLVPRVKSRVTEMVTPLKPLEAMNHSCLVAVSRVGGLLELVEEGKTGLVFEPEDAGSLAELALDVARNPKNYEEIRSAGTEWVRSHRSWQSVAEVNKALYQELLEPQ
jgi:glycosyltransferase involved in cell wall biosynthesis